MGSADRRDQGLSLSDAQAWVDAQIRSFGGYWGPFQILARLTEELGEVAAALQRAEGLRPHETSEDLEDEIGDLLFTLAAFANVHGIDLQTALERVLAKHETRDRAAWEAQREKPAPDAGGSQGDRSDE